MGVVEDLLGIQPDAFGLSHRGIHQFLGRPLGVAEHALLLQHRRKRLLGLSPSGFSFSGGGANAVLGSPFEIGSLVTQALDLLSSCSQLDHRLLFRLAPGLLAHPIHFLLSLSPQNGSCLPVGRSLGTELLYFGG